MTARCLRPKSAIFVLQESSEAWRTGVFKEEMTEDGEIPDRA